MARSKIDSTAENAERHGSANEDAGETAPNESETRLRLILESAGEGIYGVDTDGVTTFVNPAALAALGYSLAELVGRPAHATVHHTRRDGSPYPREECPIYAALRDGEI